MSKVLMIRHLPSALTFEEKQHLLKHFGAENVWETKAKRNYLFASFPTAEQAKSSLNRLHQLEIAQRRLVVEYSRDNKDPVGRTSNQNNTVSRNIKEYLNKLNAWNPSVGFLQPPPPHLKYLYPEPHNKVFINIIHAMLLHKPLYIQTLHLMNKMCLDNPFNDNAVAESVFKSMFKELFSNEISLLMQPLVNNSEPETELSSEEESHIIQSNVMPSVKRKNILPKTRKRPATILSTATIPKAKKKVVNDKVFEEVAVVEPKKISMVVPQDVLVKQSDSTNNTETLGEIGKFQKEVKPEEQVKPTVEIDKPNITKKELLRNRISYKDMKILPVFKNYHPGPPSMRLYIKNLAKTVTDQDVKRIYNRYVEGLSEIEQIGFDVRIMQEGRMKGQGFVTFPSIELAEVALNETNGYLLKDKPMVVQFARVANKKSIE